MASTCSLILTITCPDQAGIVADVSSFLTAQGAFITEAAQFGSPMTNRFYMRVLFDMERNGGGDTVAGLQRGFADIANKFDMEWAINDAHEKIRVLVCVSRFGHCLHDLLHRWQTGILPVDIVAVMSNHDDMRGISEWYGLPYHHLPVTKDTKAQQEAEWLGLVDELGVDLVVLARYMQVLTPETCAQLAGRCINIHHSFLPGFKGAKPYQQAWERGVKLIGATAHYVTPDLDEGPIIEQAVDRVDHNSMPDKLAAIGRDLENVVLSRAVTYHAERRVLMDGTSKTIIFN